MESTSKEKIVLVLPGGGVKGSFQAGFLHELIKQDKYEIEMIYASSIGSILAPLVANRRLDVLKDVFYEVGSFDEVFDEWPWYYFPWILRGLMPLFFKMGMYKKHHIVDIVWNKLSDKEKRIACDKSRVTAWNIMTKEQDWFGGDDCETSDFYKGMVASTALWLLVPPVEHKGSYYMDGGSCVFYPIEPLMKNKTNHRVIFLDTSIRTIEPPKKLPSNALELMYILHDSSLDIVAKMQETRLKEVYGDQLIMVRPEYDIFVSSTEFNKAKIEQNFEMGRQKYFQLF
jgi:predicted acylesterase/phospholipase RssA